MTGFGQMQCPNCGSSIKLFRDEHDARWQYVCKSCGTKLRLDGISRLLSNTIIVLIGLGVATFFEHVLLIAVPIAIVTIVIAIRRMFVLRVVSKPHVNPTPES